MAQAKVRVKTRKQYGQVPSIIKSLNSESARLTYNTARAIEAGAKRRVHVITGYLRDSIQRERIEYGKHRVIVGAHYGAYEEYGTRYRPPHPFFRPAVEDAKHQMRRDLKGLLSHR